MPPWSSLGEQFLRKKIAISPHCSSFLSKRGFFLQMFLSRSIKAYLCPNIKFGEANFSERRSEEVIRFLRRSVYYLSI